jgi:hypothetical protein
VPAGMSPPEWPGTVIVPASGRAAWMYCRWPPSVRSSTHPSLCIALNTSRTFTASSSDLRSQLRTVARS